MRRTDQTSLEHWRTSPLVSRVREGLVALGLPESEYFEYRLGATSDQVDYLLSISRGSALSAHRWALDLSTEGELGHSSHWRRIASLFESWADERSLVSVHVPTIWLEFDGLCSREPRVGPPSISLCLLPGYQAGRAAPHADATRCLEVAESALDGLAVESDAMLRDSLATCFHVLPRGAAWIHVSAMLGREPAAIKLYGTFPRDALLGFLLAVQWCGDLGAVASILEREYSEPLAGSEVFVDLNLDTFRDPARCSLGLAVGQRSTRGPTGQITRTPILNEWCDAGLCRADEAALAEAWLHARPPAGGSGTADKASQHRFLDLKLVWQARVELTAKAYLGYSA